MDTSKRNPHDDFPDENDSDLKSLNETYLNIGEKDLIALQLSDDPDERERFNSVMLLRKMFKRKANNLGLSDLQEKPCVQLFWKIILLLFIADIALNIYLLTIAEKNQEQLNKGFWPEVLEPIPQLLETSPYDTFG